MVCEVRAKWIRVGKGLEEKPDNPCVGLPDFFLLGFFAGTMAKYFLWKSRCYGRVVVPLPLPMTA